MFSFDTSQEFILENEYVLLRPLTQSDEVHLIPFAIDEPTIWKFSLKALIGESGMKEYISHTIRERESEKEYAFIIFDKVKNKYAGSTRLYNIQKEHSALSIGHTWIGSAFRGGLLNKNCKYLLLNFAFEALKCERVEFRADANNVLSISAMKSIGATHEGTLRSDVSIGDNLGTRRNSAVLSILKAEWNDTVKSELHSKCNSKNIKN
jgi:RimJ/RimL family protein N-acetyltransferase